MGWFDEQIRERMQRDEETLEDAYVRMASVVLDRWNAQRLQQERITAREALDNILQYYHEKPVDIPEELTDVSDELVYALRPAGLMVRDVELTDGWQRCAYGPMLGFLQESGTAVALLPGAISGYYFQNPVTGRKTWVTKQNAKCFSQDALCFYRPLPMRSLGTRDLLLYMKSCASHGDVLLLVLATLTVTLLGMIEPRVFNAVTGGVLRNRNTSLLAGMAVFLIAAAFASQLLGIIRQLLLDRIGIKTSLAVESSVMMRILSLPVSFFRRYSSGELASRADSINDLSAILLESMFSVCLSAALSLLYLTQIAAFAPALMWPSVIIVLLILAVNTAVALAQVSVSRRKTRLEAQESGMSYAMLSGIQKIKLSGSEKRAFARWGRLYARDAELEYNPPLFLRLHRVLVTGISLAGTVVLYNLAIRSGVSQGEYYAFSAAYGRLMAAFSAFAGIALSVASVPPMMEMAEPILQAEPEMNAEKESVTRVTGSIEMSHVSFRYEESMPYVLQDLSLQIRAGEYVAIVGRTGCGKSTLVRLLLGFEQPEKGAIFYDRRDLNGLDPRSLRRHIGVVMQNGELFQGDIYSNITISAPQLTMDDAWAAAETAGIAQDIREMPMGMQTIITDGQGTISGGQKQRLMIARAIAPRPEILIFDEATSALDNKTQQQISDALDKLDCTRIVIAHRLSTIRNCDRILLMEDGRILEEGTYDELIARGGAFADLVARQRLDIPA